MSLGATMAWTICTNRAGVWIMRLTLVFRTVWSVEIFSRLAIFAWLLLVESITASAAPGVLPRKCKGMREYVFKPPPFPLARDTAGAREWGGFFVLTLVPLDVGVSALPVLGGPCGFLLDVLVAVDLFGLFGVLRCIVVPVVGSHSRCAGLTRSKETVSTLPLTRIFITLPLLATTLYGPS